MEKQKTHSLAEMLGSGDSKKHNEIQFQNMQNIVSGDRAWKIQIEGEFKCGKTRFCLSVLDYLHRVRGLKPEEILLIYVDLDNGVLPLISQGIVEEELHERILYYLCNSFGEVLQATDEALKLLEEHKKKHGQISAWLIVDNMGMAWEGTRDYYAQSIYSMTMNELLIESKKKALARANAKGKDSGRIPAQEFDRMTDYSIINPLHNNWAEKIKNSNINFIWTALLKYEEKEVDGNKKVMCAKGEGQKHNAGRVDFIVRKKREKDLFLTDMIGSRYTSNLFVDIKDMEFSDFVKKIDEIMKLERKLKDKKDKRNASQKETKQDDKPVKKETVDKPVDEIEEVVDSNKNSDDDVTIDEEKNEEKEDLDW